ICTCSVGWCNLLNCMTSISQAYVGMSYTIVLFFTLGTYFD
ncbi:unnamed protein product, partial [Arabidopsis thaliana]